MNAGPTKGSALDAFAEDIRRGGGGGVFHRAPRSLWRRAAALPFSWLAFPLVWWLVRRGLLRLALALGFVAAPVLALLLIAADAWSLWRARRLARAAQPGDGGGLSPG